MNRAYLAFLPLAIAPLLAGCPTMPNQTACLLGTPTTIPASDTSAPTAALDVFLSDGRVVAVAGGSNAPVSISQPTGRLTLIAKATDANGPKDIQIWVETTSCTITAGAATCSGPGLAGRPDASNPNNGAVGSPTCSERVAQLTLDVVNTATRRVSHKVSVVALNFGGQKSEIQNVQLSAR